MKRTLWTWFRQRRLPALEPVPESDDPYVVLGVAETASWPEITAAHRRLAKQHHPDYTDEAGSHDAIRRLNIAYVELRHRRGR